MRRARRDGTRPACASSGARGWSACREYEQLQQQAIQERLGLGGPCPAVDGGVPTIRVTVGTQKGLTVRGQTSFRVRHPGLVKVISLGNDQVVVIGEGYGNTSLSFTTDAGTQTFPVTVRAAGISCGINEISKLLPCDSTLQSESPDDFIHLVGLASSFEERRGPRNCAGHRRRRRRALLQARPWEGAGSPSRTACSRPRPTPSKCTLESNRCSACAMVKSFLEKSPGTK